MHAPAFTYTYMPAWLSAHRPYRRQEEKEEEETAGLQPRPLCQGLLPLPDGG